MAAPAVPTIEIRHLGPESIELVREIDRSEHVIALYSITAGKLARRREDIDVPSWDRHGSGEHSAQRLIDRFSPVVAGGAVLLGAFIDGAFAGLAVVDPSFEPDLAWLALLHVSHRFRRVGVASALWSASTEIARGARAESMYVSATPTDSAVGFYLSRGCQLARPPHPDLFAEEPADIHFICMLD